MREQVLGYVLMSSGMIVMLFALLQMFLVFSGKEDPYALFQLSPVRFDISKLFNNQPGIAPPSSADTSIEIFSAKDTNKMMNLTVYFFLMSFVLMVGFRISSIGTMLVRPIVVKLKEAQSQNSPTQ